MDRQQKISYHREFDLKQGCSLRQLFISYNSVFLSSSWQDKLHVLVIWYRCCRLLGHMIMMALCNTEKVHGAVYDCI